MALSPRYVAAGALCLAYLGASQWLMTRTPPSPWSAVLLLAPMLGLAAVGLWRGRHRVASAGVVVLFGALALQAHDGHGIAPGHLYLFEHVAIHAFLALTFGLTLRRGVEPLITRLAARVHERLTPAMARYTRKVTLAWTVYFAAMGLLSLAVHAALPFAAWATFANVATPLALVTMFIGEYGLRYRLHPEFERAGLNEMIRAYSQARAAAGTPRSAGPTR